MLLLGVVLLLLLWGMLHASLWLSIVARRGFGSSERRGGLRVFVTVLTGLTSGKPLLGVTPEYRLAGSAIFCIEDVCSTMCCVYLRF